MKIYAHLKTMLETFLPISILLPDEVDTPAIRCMALCLNPPRCQHSYSPLHLGAPFMYCFPNHRYVADILI